MAHPHTPSTPSPSKLSLFPSLPMCRRSSLLTGQVKRWGYGPNHTTARKLGIHSILSVSDHSYIHVHSGRGESYFTYIQSIFRRGYTVLILVVYLTYKCVYVTNTVTRPLAECICRPIKQNRSLVRPTRCQLSRSLFANAGLTHLS